LSESAKRAIIIAGPNGAGKTTFATEFLPHEAGCVNFVNADLIAAGLSPFNPDLAAIRAGRFLLREIDEHVRAREDFAFETTLSGRGYARRIQQWQGLGYIVKLVFLRLPNVEAAIQRVATRVAQGGHDVPEHVIRRRFVGGWTNFENVYRPLVNTWAVYDNSGDGPILLSEGRNQ
jgi:predicted ABC-type ATPase